MVSMAATTFSDRSKPKNVSSDSVMRMSCTTAMMAPTAKLNRKRRAM